MTIMWFVAIWFDDKKNTHCSFMRTNCVYFREGRSNLKCLIFQPTDRQISIQANFPDAFFHIFRLIFMHNWISMNWVDAYERKTFMHISNQHACFVCDCWFVLIEFVKGLTSCSGAVICWISKSAGNLEGRGAAAVFNPVRLNSSPRAAALFQFSALLGRSGGRGS